MEVKLKGQDETVTLTEVERDDDHAVIGITNSGKRFAARRDQIEDPDNPEPEVEQDAREIPARHPYRIYLTSGGTLRVLDPSRSAASSAPPRTTGALPVSSSATRARTRLPRRRWRPLSEGEGGPPRHGGRGGSLLLVGYAAIREGCSTPV
jgi:hypothetical protein